MRNNMFKIIDRLKLILFIVLHIVLFILFQGDIKPENEIYCKYRDSLLYDFVLYGIIAIMITNIILSFIKGAYNQSATTFIKGAVISLSYSLVVMILEQISGWYLKNIMFDIALWIIIISCSMIIMFGIVAIWNHISKRKKQNQISVFGQFSIVNGIGTILIILGCVIALFTSYGTAKDDTNALFLFVNVAPVLVILEIIGLVGMLCSKILQKKRM